MQTEGGGCEVQASPSHWALSENTIGPTDAVESCWDDTKRGEIKALPWPWIQA